jgi:hypothetical protein
MFLLNGNPLAVDTAFTNDGIQYPANWLRLASAEEKASIGITEVADTVRADDRFYWNGDINNPKALEDVLATKEDGSPLMVQVYNPVTEAMEDTSKQVVTKGLKSAQVAQIKSSAGFLLASTDWYVVRKADIGTDIPEDVATYRSAVRAESDRLETEILAVTTVDALMAIEPNWPTL